jgi:transposase
VARKKRRSFTQAFKEAAVNRMATAESVRGLADEPGVGSKLLYNWRDRLQSGGCEALRRVGRPSRSIPLDIEQGKPPANLTDPGEAQRRIDELERKIGQQQLDLDFFRAALRHVRDQRLTKAGFGETTSTR